ncbi:MAG: adenylosuccinate lyase [Legionella sp.]|nr:adenylosuccinate lyase [Legionella sp.]
MPGIKQLIKPLSTLATMDVFSKLDSAPKAQNEVRNTQEPSWLKSQHKESDYSNSSLLADIYISENGAEGYQDFLKETARKRKEAEAQEAKAKENLITEITPDITAKVIAEQRLKAISPVDGRYARATLPLSEYMSESALIKYRVKVEVEYFKILSRNASILGCPALSIAEEKFLDALVSDFNIADALRVKAIEKTTNHDVKAVEYLLKEKFKSSPSLEKLSEFIHFGLTSDDTNNLAYALMLKDVQNNVIIPKLTKLIDKLSAMAKENMDAAMLSRTHGQAATPTTMGKELSNFKMRLEDAKANLEAQRFFGKANGAVGNHNASVFSYPGVDWRALEKTFVEETLGLTQNTHTTQIEPHDWVAKLSHSKVELNTILIDLSQDIWRYISDGYFKQHVKANEVGSSTMPHKVNPIDFENAEGNLGLAIALFEFFARKLPVSRLQRDLSDSTVLRALAEAEGHELIALGSLLRGLAKLEADCELMEKELSTQWVLLAEPIQMVMRRYAVDKPYEKLKALTRGRGRDITQQDIHEFIDTLTDDLPAHEIIRLKALTPQTYLGYAKELTVETVAATGNVTKLSMFGAGGVLTEDNKRSAVDSALTSTALPQQ